MRMLPGPTPPPPDSYHQSHTWEDFDLPGSGFFACPFHPFSDKRDPQGPPSVGMFRAPCLLRPEKAWLPSWPLAAPPASVAMTTVGRLAPVRAAGGGRGRGPERPCVSAAAPSQHMETLKVLPPALLASPALQPLPVSALAPEGQLCPAFPPGCCSKCPQLQPQSEPAQDPQPPVPSSSHLCMQQVEHLISTR